MRQLYHMVYAGRYLCHTGVRRMRILLAFLSLPFLAGAQAPQILRGAEPVSPAWDTSKIVAAFADQAGRLKPILDQLTPQEWVPRERRRPTSRNGRARGRNWTTWRQSAQSFENGSGAVDAGAGHYFRWQRLASDLNSLVDGVRQVSEPGGGRSAGSRAGREFLQPR